MNRSLISLILSIALLPVICFAGTKKPPLHDDRILITQLDINKRTIEFTHESHKIATNYLLAPDLTVEIHGRSASLKNVKLGMEVKGFRLGPGTDTPQSLEDLDLK